MEVKNADGNYFLMRAFPYRIGPDVYAGVLLTFVNIDLTKQMQKALEHNDECNVLAQKGAKFGIWNWYIETNELTWSENIEDLFDYFPHHHIEYFIDMKIDINVKISFLVKCLFNPFVYGFDYFL